MSAPTPDLLFQTAIFLASACAGTFWLSSATGNTVTLPWRTSVKVPPEKLAAHQAKWNGLAAASASIAALFQGVQILYNFPFLQLLHIK
jgi:hypothetical protein